MAKVLLALGNRLGRDDALGMRVAEGLQGSDWQVITTTNIENALGLIGRIRPELLVVVDAASMGLPPGSIRRLPLFPSERMLGSTHGLPLSFLLSQIQGAAGEIVLIGVEPKELGFGGGLSPEVEEAARTLAELLREGRISAIPEIPPRITSP